MKCGQDNCFECPYPDCDPKYWNKPVEVVEPKVDKRFGAKKTDAEKKATAQERHRRHNQKRKDYIAEYHKKWLERNREHFNEYLREYRKRAKEKAM